MRKLLNGFPRSYVMAHRQMTNDTEYWVSGGANEKIISQFAVPGGFEFLGVMHLDADTPGCRWSWRYNRLFWYRFRKQIPGPSHLCWQNSFMFNRGFADFANPVSRPLWFDLEDLVDRSRDIDMLIPGLWTSVCGLYADFDEGHYVPQMIPLFCGQNHEALG